MKIYKIKELIAKLEALQKQGCEELCLLELLETIGWEDQDLKEVVEILTDPEIFLDTRGR